MSIAIIILCLGALAIVVCIYLLTVVSSCNMNAFFGKQYVALFERDVWRRYKQLKSHPELYVIMDEDDLYDLNRRDKYLDEYRYGTSPYYILKFLDDSYGVFKRDTTEGQNNCVMGAYCGGQFLIKELVELKTKA